MCPVGFCRRGQWIPWRQRKLRTFMPNSGPLRGDFKLHYDRTWKSIGKMIQVSSTHQRNPPRYGSTWKLHFEERFERLQNRRLANDTDLDI